MRLLAGLAKKEDCQYITYYCPHCHALNKSNQLEGDGNGSPSNHIIGPEEVLSTSAGSFSPPTQDAVSNSAMVLSSALSSRGKPIAELDSDNSLSDT
jgi:hypothetical protein